MVKHSLLSDEERSLIASSPPVNVQVETKGCYQSISYESPTTQFEPEPRPSGTSAFAAIFIVVNAAMGAGLLNFPNAYGEAGGLWQGLLMQAIFLIFIITSLFALAYCSHVHSSTTYQGVVEVICGKAVGIAAELCIIIYMFGTGIAMIIILGDQFDKVLEAIFGINFCHHWYMNRMFTMSAFSAVIILPLCIPKDIGFLKHASIVGVLATIFVMLTVTVKYFTGEHHPVYVPDEERTWSKSFSSIPAIFFAYQCHVSSVPVYATLQKKTMTNWSVVISCSMALCTISYCATGIFGYLTFGDAAKSDILQSYDAKDTLVIVARIAIAIAMITTYPILQFCGRAAGMTLLSKTGLLAVFPSPKMEKIRRCTFTLLWFFASLTISLFIPNIGEAIALIGGFAGCFILVFPGLAFSKLIYHRNLQRTWKSNILIVFGLFIFICGIFLFGEITTRAIIDNVRGNNQELSSKCYAT